MKLVYQENDCGNWECLDNENRTILSVEASTGVYVFMDQDVVVGSQYQQHFPTAEEAMSAFREYERQSVPRKTVQVVLENQSEGFCIAVRDESRSASVVLNKVLKGPELEVFNNWAKSHFPSL